MKLSKPQMLIIEKMQAGYSLIRLRFSGHCYLQCVRGRGHRYTINIRNQTIEALLRAGLIERKTAEPGRPTTFKLTAAGKTADIYS